MNTDQGDTMMTKVYVDGKYRTVRWQTANQTRAIVEYEGLFVLVDLKQGVWELSGEPARGAEVKAFDDLLLETNDKTIVTITEEEKP